MKPGFPFPVVKYQRYKNTFLQNVMVVYKFGQIDEHKYSAIEFEEGLKDFVSSNFGLEIDKEIISKFWDTGLSISRSDNSMSWFFSNNSVAVNIGTRNYTSFVDDVLPQAYKLRSFLDKVLNVDSINALQLRKLNVWQFPSVPENCSSGGFDAESIRQSVFSDQLIKSESSTLDDEEKGLSGFCKVRFTEGDEDVIIRHLYKKLDKSFMLYLDTESILMNCIKLKEIEECLCDMNETLFNAYHWSVKDCIIDIMKG